jgi:DNA-binding transcriptional LysR family regulator
MAKRENVQDLMAFVAVAKERSFTKAAGKLGVSQSALSHAMRGLEARLGLRLLTRTTRSVSPTEAGELLLQAVAPRFEEIAEAIEHLSELRDKPAGMVRISATDYAFEFVLCPKLGRLLPAYPDINVEVAIEYGLIDIVAQRYDAGVRAGAQVAKDMIAVRIGPDFRQVIVGSPAYFERHPRPRTPDDLTKHNCVNLRLSTQGGVLPWELQKGKRELRVKVEGQVVVNGAPQKLQAALCGLGLARVPEDYAAPFEKAGQLIRVLDDWAQTYPGYHLYYPSRRQPTPAFSLVVDALRHRD